MTEINDLGNTLSFLPLGNLVLAGVRTPSPGASNDWSPTTEPPAGNDRTDTGTSPTAHHRGVWLSTFDSRRLPLSQSIVFTAVHSVPISNGLANTWAAPNFFAIAR